MRSDPRVGFIIPSMGARPDWLDACAASIATQDYGCIEAVMVGPRSAVLEAVAKRYGWRMLHQTPQGLSRAINYGYSTLMHCEYVSWLGDDDLLAPGSVRKMVDGLEARTSAKFAYGRTRCIDEMGQTIYLTHPSSLAPIYARVGQDYIPQPGSLVRVSALTGDNLVDPELRNAMDLELFLRLGRRTADWLYVPEEVSAYRIHGGAITSQKGVHDEGQMVRELFLPASRAHMLRRIRPVLSLLEKAHVYAWWHAPTVTPPPILHGRPYTVHDGGSRT